LAVLRFVPALAAAVVTGAALPMPSGPGLVPARPDSAEIAYDDGTLLTWWCSDRDSFGAAVRFTPREYPCEVVGGRAVLRYDLGQNIYIRVYDDDGPSGKPGTLLAERLCAGIQRTSDSTFKNHDLTSPVSIASGDFHVCFWQKGVFHMVFASDQQFDSSARQLWFFPDQGWVTPYGMHVADHLIRARVRYGITGVEEELTARPVPGLSLLPNPATGDRVRFSSPWSGRARLTVRDLSGRAVMSKRIQSRAGAAQYLDVSGCAPGVYMVELDFGTGTATAKLAIR
jgi:hypothetical protein